MTGRWRQLSLALSRVLLMSSLAVHAQALTLGVHPEEPAPALAAVLVAHSEPALPLQQMAFADQKSLLEALQAGRIDAALIEAPAQPLPRVRLIADLYPSVLHVLYPADWGATDLRTLLTRGSVWAGGEGSIGRKLVRELQADYQLSDAQISLLPDPISTRPDVWMIFGGILGRDALRRMPGYRLFDFEPGAGAARESIAEGIALRHPQLHTMTLPRRLYPSLDSPKITTLAVHNQLAVRADLPEAQAFALAALVDQARQPIAAAYPLTTLDTPERSGIVPHALVSHAGAVRFEQRNEPSFLERYAEVFAFLLTALVALASALVAIARYRQQRRKDRLDRFFQRLLQQRDTEPRARAETIRSLQSDVIELVVRERISADGALLAFLSLSNQLLAEAEQAAT
ncbi:MAG: hypothetical protein AAGI15_04645 [Pseudomonadota bacterium]